VTIPTIVLLNDIQGLKSAGIEYPNTVDGWRWLYRCRRERGLDKAFKKLGARVVVDVPKYLELIRKSTAR
jgi:hypothetical protein